MSLHTTRESEMTARLLELSKELAAGERCATDMAHLIKRLCAERDELRAALQRLYDAAPEVHPDPRAQWGSACAVALAALNAAKGATP